MTDDEAVAAVLAGDLDYAELTADQQAQVRDAWARRVQQHAATLETVDAPSLPADEAAPPSTSHDRVIWRTPPAD